ncbi:MAG: hypothetical protein ABR501_01685 [Pyrinomonadaceae bacterium]
MVDLKRKLLVLLMGSLLLIGAPMGVYAQKQGGDKRPPKDDNKVVVRPKDEKPPPSNNNQGRGQGDKRDGGRKGKP